MQRDIDHSYALIRRRVQPGKAVAPVLRPANNLGRGFQWER